MTGGDGAAAEELGHALPRYLPAFAAAGLGSLLLLVMSIWAALTTVEVVVTAPGSARPVGGTAPLRAPDSRSVSRLLVREGQRVTNGQALLELEPRPLMEQWRATARVLEHKRGELSALRQALRWLDAPEGEGAELSASARLRIAAHRSRLAEIGSEVRALESELAAATRSAVGLQGLLAIARQRRQAADAARRAGALSEFDLLGLRRQELSASTELEEQRGRVAAARQRLTARRHARRTLQADFRQSLLDQASRLETQVAELASRVAELAERHRQGRIVAPMTGLVDQLLVAEGAFVERGDALGVVVPDPAAIIFEARLAPGQLAFLRPGQACRLKLEALPFARYGALPCTLESIGHDVIQGRDGPPHYRVKVRPAATLLLADGEPYRLQPGASGWVDIVAGKRSVLSFVTEPLWRFARESLRER